MLKKSQYINDTSEKAVSLNLLYNPGFLKEDELREVVSNSLKEIGWNDKDVQIGCDLLFGFVSGDLHVATIEVWQNLDLDVRKYVLSLVSSRMYRTIRNNLSSIPASVYKQAIIDGLGSEEVSALPLSDEELKVVDEIAAAQRPLSNDSWEELSDAQRAELLVKSNVDEANTILQYIGTSDFLFLVSKLSQSARTEVLNKIDNLNTEAMLIDVNSTMQILDLICHSNDVRLNLIGRFSEQSLDGLDGLKEVIKTRKSSIEHRFDELCGFQENETLTSNDMQFIEARKGLLLAQNTYLDCYLDCLDIAKNAIYTKGNGEHVLVNAQNDINSRCKVAREQINKYGVSVGSVVSSFTDDAYSEPTLDDAAVIVSEILNIM